MPRFLVHRVAPPLISIAGSPSFSMRKWRWHLEGLLTDMAMQYHLYWPGHGEGEERRA